MRAVVQRVTGARVRIGDRTVGEIGPGLVVLVGVAGDDGLPDVEYLAGKVRDLRIFDDQAGKMNRTVADVGGGLLVVSQFTLCGDVRRGRRPSFDRAAPPALARALYDAFVVELRASGLAVATGEFQARMAVELINEGPVTILLDSKKLF